MRKLTDSDKQEILKLYRETAETTSTLAERYEVSNSTISRLLKSTLPEDEYEYLVSLKRAARTPEGRAQVSYDQVPSLTTAPKEEEIQPLPSPKEESFPLLLPNTSLPTQKVRNAPRKVKVIDPPQPVAQTQPNREDEAYSEEADASKRVRRRTSVPIPKQPIIAEQLELLEIKNEEIVSTPSPILEGERPNATVIAQMLGEDLLDESEEDDLDDDDLDDEDYDEEDDDEEAKPLVRRRYAGDIAVQVLPLSAAHLPKTCYLVIDRSSELITRPLKDFGDLGQIPNIETQQKTLPIFDNHRVAKRFSTKRDRVIKVPDSKMLHKARTHLEAKGITRLLIDGQVYSLSI